MPKSKMIVITGPTAVGKTELSVELAQKFNGEIINGDSMQIYKELSIGTAKPTQEERQGIPHHLFNIRSVQEAYSASNFKKDADAIVQHIHQLDKVPILVGGTGLYLETFIYNLSLGGKVSPNFPFREKMEKRAEEQGSEGLYQELLQVDPKAAESVHPNNIKRIIRILEVCYFSNQLFSAQEETHQHHQSPFDLFIIALNTDRELLYERINQRVDLMLERGLLEEANWLYEQHLPEKAQSVKAIGYKEFFPFFRGEESLDHAVASLKQNSRRYAKRQLTWIRNRLDDVHNCDIVQHPEQKVTLEQNIATFLDEMRR